MSYIVYSTKNWQPVTDGFDATVIRFVPCAIRFEENSPEIIQQKMAANLILLATTFADITAHANRGGYNFLAIQTNVGRQMEFQLDIPATLIHIRSNPPLAATTFTTTEPDSRPIYNLMLGFHFCFL